MTITGNDYGVLSLRHHQDAQQAKDVKFKNGKYQQNEALRQGITLLHTQFKALVEGIDFEFNILGEIKRKTAHA